MIQPIPSRYDPTHTIQVWSNPYNQGMIQPIQSRYDPTHTIKVWSNPYNPGMIHQGMIQPIQSRYDPTRTIQVQSKPYNQVSFPITLINLNFLCFLSSLFCHECCFSNSSAIQTPGTHFIIIKIPICTTRTKTSCVNESMGLLCVCSFLKHHNKWVCHFKSRQRDHAPNLWAWLYGSILQTGVWKVFWQKVAFVRLGFYIIDYIFSSAAFHFAAPAGRRHVLTPGTCYLLCRRQSNPLFQHNPGHILYLVLFLILFWRRLASPAPYTN